jgi:hypothetical protein
VGLKTDIKNAFKKSLGPDAVNDGNLDSLASELRDAIKKYIQAQTFEITELKCDLEVEQLKTTAPLSANVLPSVTIVNGFGPGNVVLGTNGVLIPPINYSNKGGQGGALQSKGNAHINKKPNTSDNSSKIKLLTSVKED